jgi:hypothetical protein
MTRSVPTALKNSYFAKASHALLLQEGFSRAGCPLVRARLRLKIGAGVLVIVKERQVPL